MYCIKTVVKGKPFRSAPVRKAPREEAPVVCVSGLVKLQVF